MTKEEPWAVVGGGLLGLTVAHTLSKLGRSVTLFEAAPQLGGLASAWKLGDIVWDRYYHVTLYSDSELRSLLQELNLDGQMHWSKTQTGFYSRGQLFPFSNAFDFARFPLLNPVEKVRLAGTILYASRYKDWQKLEQVTVEEWLTKLSGRGVFEKIWLPLLKAKLGDDYATTSATFIWATIQRLYAARQSGLKEELFGYLPGGYSRMLAAFQAAVESLHVSIHVNAKVTEVSTATDGLQQVQLASGSTHFFKRVIVTAPAPLAGQMCPELTEAERHSLNQTPYLGIICGSALLKRPLSPYYVTNILDPSIPFTGLIEMSALVDPAELGNRHLVYVPHYLRPDDPDFQRTDDDLTAEAKRSLKQMHPDLHDSDFLDFKISRARYVFPRPIAGPSRSVPPVDTSIPGLNFINSAQITNGTLNANETVGLARRAARALHASSS